MPLLTLRSLRTAEVATLPHTYAVYAAAVANVTTFIVTPKGGRVLVVTGKHLITIGFAGNGYRPLPGAKRLSYREDISHSGLPPAVPRVLAGGLTGESSCAIGASWE